MELLKASEVPAEASAAFRESARGKWLAVVIFSALALGLVAAGGWASTGGVEGLPVLVFAVLGAAAFLLLAGFSLGALRGTHRRRTPSWSAWRTTTCRGSG